MIENLNRDGVQHTKIVGSVEGAEAWRQLARRQEHVIEKQEMRLPVVENARERLLEVKNTKAATLNEKRKV